MNSELAALLPKRTGGATNVRGLIFQFLYSLKCAMELYEPSCAWDSIAVEQFEDIDLHLKPIQLAGVGSTRYCQSKTSIGTWFPSDLEKPLRSFLEILLADPQARFVMVFDFIPTGQVAEMAQFNKLNATRKQKITTIFRRLCKNAARASESGKVVALSISDADADELLQRLSFETYDEESLIRDIKQKMGQHFGLAGDRVDEYFSIFFAQFTHWSRERRRITQIDLDTLRDTIEANCAFEAEFTARGQMLIRKLDWINDETPNDFFQGKATRPGHISADLDVPRPQWIKQISDALDLVDIVIVRSSSGQGKSTLAFRFAHDKWPPQHTFVLQSAQTSTEVDLVKEYLRARVQTYGLPIFLLVDNANRRTAFWSDIAQECARLGVQTLVTLRQEDWARFAKQSLFSFKVVEPLLSLTEAREIFRFLKQRELAQKEVISAEWGYERIGEPHLLMEFIYLVTQGQMLEDRLREQMDGIREHEDPIKLEIVRRVVLADALGVPVVESRLFEDLRSEWGVSALAAGSVALLRSLEGEYLRRHEKTLSGLHWVRSEHLVRLLHGGYPTPAATALAVLRAIPSSYLSHAVSGALTRPDMKDQFLQGLIERAQTAPFDEIVAYLEGVFEAGEIRFFEANRALFDESYSQFGGAGPFWLSMDHPPSLGKKFLSKISENLSDLGGLGPVLTLSSRFHLVDRGHHDCRQMLQSVSSRLQGDALAQDIGVTGDLMAWSGWCGISWPAWEPTRDVLLNRLIQWDFSVEDLCKFHEGLWLFDRNSYRDHTSTQLGALRDYLQWKLDCLSLELGDVPEYPQDKEGAQGELSLEFLGSDYENAGKNAVDRLTKLYSLFPFYGSYRSKAFWSLDFPMAHDPSVKALPQDSQYLRFMVARNSFWSRLVESRYAVHTYYEFARAWHEVRRRTISVLNALADRLELLLSAQVTDLRGTFDGDSDPKAFHESLLRAPEPPEQTPPDLQEKLKILNEWNSHLSAWLGQFTETAVYFQEHGHLPLPEDDAAHSARLALFNLRDAMKDLALMQEAMRALFDIVGDVFQTNALEEMENAAFARAVAAEEVWLEERPTQPISDLKGFLHNKRELRWRDFSTRLKNALSPLEGQGMEFVYPSDLYYDFPLSFLPLGFIVSDPCNLVVERDALLSALDLLADDVNFGCLIPMIKGDDDKPVRFLPGGFQVGLEVSASDDEFDLRTREAVLSDVQELPDGVYALLPETPLHESPRLRFKATLHRLLFEMESFSRQRARIEELAVIPGRFTARLYSHKRLWLLSQFMKQGVDFDELESLFQEHFGHKTETPEHEVASNLIGTALSLHELQNEFPIHENQDFLTSEQEEIWQQTEALGGLDYSLGHQCVLALVLS